MAFKLILIISLEILIFCQLPIDNSSYINQEDFSIKNSVYIIRNREGNVNFENIFTQELKNSKQNLKKNFEVVIDKEIENSNVFYFIKDKENNVILSSDKENKLTTIIPDSNNNSYALWNITPKINKENKLIYYVQNKKTGFYWELEHKNNRYNLKLSNKTSEQSLNELNEFLFIELFQESNRINSDLLKNESIDVLIKYIDLNDPDLNRMGIHQIKKDFDHCELKYCVRSILQNIPWIRKIFILMPNERVKYFKSKEEIEDKIVYVKDKDLLGFDTGNIYTFQFNLHKLKKFGLSENFIYMDDDYFIAKPINKNEMFYEDNGKIYPAIITSDFYELNKELIIQQLNKLRGEKDSNNPHSPNGFYIVQKQAFLFVYHLFGNDDIRYGKKLIEPSFSHNAIPLKISDIEEIHNYIDNNYEHGKTLLNSKERSLIDIQFQTLYWVYVKNKYNRKVSKVSSEFYDITAIFEREKMMLEKLFPTKTKYELDENEEKNKNKDTDNIALKTVDSIKNLIINEINNKIYLNLEKYLSEIENAKRKKKNENKNRNGEYKKILKEEIEMLKNQCFWQEMANLFLVCVFVLLIVHRFLTKDY